MSSSNTGATDSSATESDDAIIETDSDMDIDDDNSDCPPDTDSCPFSEGEKVLAFHSSRIYEAKVRKIEFRLKAWSFFVHYLGWSKKWDEWVCMDRLMKFTEENVQKQQARNKEQLFEKNTKLPRPSPVKPRVARTKKRNNDSVGKEQGLIPLDKLVNIQLPPPLKKQLVDDCEFITHLGKLVKLPRTPTVDDIIMNYGDYRMKKDGSITSSEMEVLMGILRYFDKVLPVMLLYKNERQQYKEAISNDVRPSTIYGAEHLLRLFVKLPELLYQASIEEETLMELTQKLVRLLKFLQKHQSAYFLSTYHVPEDTERSSYK